MARRCNHSRSRASGRPRVFVEQRAGIAYVDPALHAVPPSKGVVIHDGARSTAWGPVGCNKLRIDTTTLTNGVHKLLIGRCITDTRIATVHCGTPAVRVTVDD